MPIPKAVTKRGIVLVLLVVAGLAVIAIVTRLQGLTRDKAIAELEKRYGREVELQDLSISLLPSIRISGRGLVVHQKDRAEPPPFIAVERFSAQIPFWRALRRPLQLDVVLLQGLKINVPTGRDKEISQGEEQRRPGSQAPGPAFLIDRIVADGTTLTILPKKAGGDPLVFDIQRLTLRSVGVGRPMQFQTALTNAKPPGTINSTGQFGPWNNDEPGLTPVSGGYTFKDADLGVFKGISGTLSSMGRYSGVLERIVVDGQTDTPNFALDVSRHSVHLKTQFHAIVDGTNGDTLLEPVKAQFLRTSIVAKGGVVGQPGRRGKTIRLDVDVSESRVEDLLTLAIKNEKPPLTGWATFQTQFELPPGSEDVISRLRLDGRFGISSAQFSDLNVQEKVNELSERARGDVEQDATDDRVVSDLGGDFRLNQGTAQFSKLFFRVPGAAVRLNGQYGLLTENLDFRGKVQMDAKLSETTSGFKSVFIKILDPFFRKNGKTVLPIKISGDLSQPSFGLDL